MYSLFSSAPILPILVKLPVCNETNFSSTSVAIEMLTVEKAQYNSFTKDKISAHLQHNYR